jgi:two-component sensor histidine kinase
MGTISGEVNGPHQGLKLVLYARSGRWYVQPYADEPFTTINPDSTWSSPTHLGTDYAALLVQPGYVPAGVIDAIPGSGGSVVAIAVTEGTPAVWRRWWFRLLLVWLGVAAVIALYRWRIVTVTRQMNLRFEERLAERTRIAQELHDTLLQGLLSMSMHLHVAMDQLPEDSAARATLSRVMELMGPAIEEGRNTIRGLRSSIEHPDDLISSLTQIPHEFGDQAVDFRVVVEGSSVPLRNSVRDEVYRIGREALVNAFRHSGATKITLRLEYATEQFRMLVEDNGCGIRPSVLSSGRDGHCGLSGMQKQAERIGGKLRLMSRAGFGTEIELRVRGQIAFELTPSKLASKWLTTFQNRQSQNELTPK